MGARPRLGLRERKKVLTRQAILDTAQAMFDERGYDHVTVAEIADAVNISAKTVFSYFPSKEDLVFCQEAELRARLRERIRDRAVGQTPLDAMVGVMHELMSESGSRAVDDLERLYRTVGDSVTLQSRLRLMWEQFEQAVAEVLADEAGEPRHAPRPRVVAAQLLLIFRLMSSEHLLGYLQAHAQPSQRAALETWLEVSVEMVGHGIADHARRPCGSG